MVWSISSATKTIPASASSTRCKLDGSGLQRISREDGTHAATFADDGKHYFDEFSALMTPPRLSACDSAAPANLVWDSRNIDAYGLTPPKFLDFKANDGTTLYGQLLLPPNDSATGKIPLIVNIYGGPAAQLVQDTWIENWSGSSGLFHQILSREGFAIFTVDNRGTPARNRKFQTAVRHQFGAIELQDQLAALDQVFSAISPTRPHPRRHVGMEQRRLHDSLRHDPLRPSSKPAPRFPLSPTGATTIPSTPSATTACPPTKPAPATATSISPKSPTNCTGRYC